MRVKLKREAGSGGNSSYKYLVSGTNREKKNLFCRKEGIIRTIDEKRHRVRRKFCILPLLIIYNMTYNVDIQRRIDDISRGKSNRRNDNRTFAMSSNSMWESSKRCQVMILHGQSKENENDGHKITQ
jgi:hypothetical protein